jgi:acyl dehydratase
VAVNLRNDERPGPHRGRVDADAVFAYARAINDLNPLYLNGEAVPPAFTVTLVRSALSGSAPAPGTIDAIDGRDAGVHGEHDIFLYQPVVPDQQLQWQSEFAGLRQTSGGVVLTRRIVVKDGSGVALVEHLWSDYLIGATIRGEYMASDLPDHTFPEAARERPVGTRRVPVDRDQGFRYAGVSGDHAPHAMDDEVARSEGYPGKILQGLCTFGLCCGAAIDVVAGGDPLRVRRIAQRFAAPAFPGRDLEVTLYDAGRTEAGLRSFAFEAVQDGIAVIKHGRVVVAD